MKIFKINSDFDWALIVLPLVLSVCGLATLYGIATISGKMNLLSSQILYLALGIGIYLFCSLLDYRLLKAYGKYLYLVGLLLLLVVEFFGLNVFGSTRWIDLGFTQIQPSEIMKFFILILLAGIFSQNKKLAIWQTLVVFAIIIVPVVFILKEPDLGTALTIMAFSLGMIVFSPISRKILIAVLILMLVVSPVVWMNLKAYQKQRLLTFVNPYSDPLGAGYNVNQARIAVGSGGLFGKGFSGATQSQLQFLPVAHIDFIFSGWAEATGFAGSLLMVVIFAFLIWRIFRVSFEARDDFGCYIAIGAGLLIFFQSFINIGMNIGIVPVTGISLPFVSYGGTSFLTNAAILGLVQSVYLRRRAFKLG